MKKSHCLFLLFIALLLLGVSCKTYHPAFVLSLHEFEDPKIATRLSKTVQDPTRQFSHTIRRYAFLDARSFLGGEIYGPDENGRYGLRIAVDQWHHGIMHQTAGANLGLIYAVMMDGMYMGYSHFDKSMRDTEILEIEPLWNLRDAQMILDSIPKNYKHFNNWHEPFFQR
ncbi:MAG: hypothetical protein IKS83_04205 [Victivallales bacterium]|nr:hypothetical protein [Victivallales bacterium]